MLNQFGTNSEILIDGAFLIPREIMFKISDLPVQEESYILYYDFKRINEKIAEAEKIARKYNLPLKVIHQEDKYSLEEWLAIIRNAKLVLSRSYHAIVTSIIFNVPFIQFFDKRSARFSQLYKVLKLNPCISDENFHIDFDKINLNFDWEQTNKIIAEEKIRAQQWLKQAVEAPKLNNSDYDMLNLLAIESLMSKKQKIVLQYKPLERIFSVKNSPDRKHKVLMLTGLSIKWKRK